MRPRESTDLARRATSAWNTHPVHAAGIQSARKLCHCKALDAAGRGWHDFGRAETCWLPGVGNAGWRCRATTHPWNIASPALWLKAHYRPLHTWRPPPRDSDSNNVPPRRRTHSLVLNDVVMDNGMVNPPMTVLSLPPNCMAKLSPVTTQYTREWRLTAPCPSLASRLAAHVCLPATADFRSAVQIVQTQPLSWSTTLSNLLAEAFQGCLGVTLWSSGSQPGLLWIMYLGDMGAQDFTLCDQKQKKGKKTPCRLLLAICGREQGSLAKTPFHLSRHSCKETLRWA